MTDIASISKLPPTAFISYAHSHSSWDGRRTEEWRTTVLQFANLLCSMGIDAELDQYHAHDPEVDWNRFGIGAAQRADFVLIAASRAYRERWEGENEPTEGSGAVREANTLMGEFNADQDSFQRRVKLVLLPGADEDDIPKDLSNLQRFIIREISEEAVEDLYRTLTGQPATPKPPIGAIRELAPRVLVPAQEAAVDAAEQAQNAGEIAELRLALARIEAALADVSDVDMAQALRGNFSLPWIRALYEMLGEREAIVNRLVELGEIHDAEPGEDLTTPSARSEQERLEILLNEIFAASGAHLSEAAISEIARRLRAPTTGPEQLDAL